MMRLISGLREHLRKIPRGRRDWTPDALVGSLKASKRVLWARNDRVGQRRDGFPSAASPPLSWPVQSAAANFTRLRPLLKQTSPPAPGTIARFIHQGACKRMTTHPLPSPDASTGSAGEGRASPRRGTATISDRQISCQDGQNVLYLFLPPQPRRRSPLSGSVEAIPQSASARNRSAGRSRSMGRGAPRAGRSSGGEARRRSLERGRLGRRRA